MTEVTTMHLRQALKPWKTDLNPTVIAWPMRCSTRDQVSNSGGDACADGRRTIDVWERSLTSLSGWKQCNQLW